MSSKLNMERLKKNRCEIIKAEILSLLFNLGKTHIYFGREVDNNTKKVFQDKYGFEPIKKYKEYFTKDCYNKDLDHNVYKDDDYKRGRYKYVKSFLEENLKFDGINIIKGKKSITLKDIVEENPKNKKSLFFNGCESINSGIDKGVLSDGNTRIEDNKWISNAFGGNPKLVEDKYYDEERIKFYKKFEDKFEEELKNIKNIEKSIEDFKIENWLQIRKFEFEEVKKWYSNLLSDDRLPVNDVTLWDQAYMVSTLFKASISAMCLEDKKRDDYNKAPSSAKWSIMGVQYDKLGLSEKGSNQSIISWYKKACRDTDDAVKSLIEKTYALGNEIYRDESGIYFLVPENLIGHEKKEKLYDLNPDCKEIEDAVIKEFSSNFHGEVYPVIYCTSPSRGIMSITYLLEKAKESFLENSVSPKTLIYDLKNNSEDNSGDILGRCDICRIHPVYRKNDLKSCEFCRGKDKDRLEDWLKKRNDETIWTGEIQDSNGRIALITMKFELMEWLDGKMISNLAQKEVNWEDDKKEILDFINSKKNPKKTDYIFNFFDFNAPKFMKSYKTVSDEINKRILNYTKGTELETYICKKLNGFIDYDNMEIEWDKMSHEDKEFLSEMFLYLSARKNPSPARIKRIWDSTEDFLETIKKEIKSKLNEEKCCCCRIVWEEAIPKEKANEEKEYEISDIQFQSDESGNVYLISSIEQAIRVISKEKDIKKVKNQIVSGNKDWIKDEIEIQEMGENADNQKLILKNDKNLKYEKYVPYFSIMDVTPISWQFIIPADKVNDLIEITQDCYKRCFGLVEGKLPFHIGIVVQNYKKPLYMGIKALRKIRRDIYDWKDIETEKDGEYIKSKIEKNFSCILSSTEGKLYDELKNEGNNLRNCYSLYSFKNGSEFLLKDLKENKGCWKENISKYNRSFSVYPNTVDFEFLDVNTRRNDIYYKNGKRILLEKRNRPYTWDEWEYFKNYKVEVGKNISNRKVQTIAELIYGKLKDWKDEKECMRKLLPYIIQGMWDENDKKNKDFYSKLFGCDTWERLKESSDFERNLYTFLDIFQFWHTALKYDEEEK